MVKSKELEIGDTVRLSQTFYRFRLLHALTVGGCDNHTLSKAWVPKEIDAPHCLINMPLSVKERCYADKHKMATKQEIKPAVAGLTFINDIPNR